MYMTIHTSTGCRLYIGPVVASTVDTEAEFEALSYTEISQVQDLGEFGDTAEELTFEVIHDDRLQSRKGSVDGGILPLVLSYDLGDAGQAALKAASASRSNYAFKILFGGDEPVEAFYFRGRVLSFRKEIGGRGQGFIGDFRYRDQQCDSRGHGCADGGFNRGDRG